MKLGFRLNRVVAMHKAVLGALSLAVVLSAGACQSHAKKPLPDSSVINYEQQEQGGFRTQWQWALGLNKDEKIENLWVLSDTLYVYTTQNQLHSFVAATGTKKWTMEVSANRIKLFTPIEVADGKTLMLVSHTDIYYVDKINGVILRRATLAQSTTTQPIISGENICYGSAGALYSTYLNFPDTMDWTIRADDDSFVAPLLKVDDSNLVAVTHRGYVWAVNPSTGIANWSLRKVNGTVIATPAVSPDKKVLIILASDKKAYAFNFNNGNELWNARLNGELTQPAIFNGKSVLAVGDGEGLFALDIATGDQKWFVKGVTQILRNDENELIVADKNGSLIRINPADGSQIAFSRIKDADLFLAASTSQGSIFVATKDGRIASVNLAK